MMTNKQKMIIITSDEDVIRQVSLTQAPNTRIIDLDQIGQTPFSPNNDILMGLALLANLPQSNANHDQLLKRSLQSSDEDRPKSIKTSKKSGDLTCAICADRAIGYNYNVLSCGSCKAFFRRNAHHDPTHLRCLMGENQCSIEYKMSRKCQKCRLEQCLTQGMRKDFLLTEEQKEQRRKHLEDNRNNTLQRLSTIQSSNEPQTTTNIDPTSPSFDEIDRLLMDLDGTGDDFLDQNNQLNGIEDLLFGTLSIEDWTIIESFKSSFESLFPIPELFPPPFTQLPDHFTAFVFWSNFTNELALKCINYFRQIIEFEQFPLDDRVVLIKYNLFPVFALFKCYHYREGSFPFPPPMNIFSEEVRQHQLFLMKNNLPINSLDSIFNLIKSLVQITKQDPKLLSLMLVIMFFTPGLSMSEDEPILKDPLAVHRAQLNYTKVLWNYLMNQSGEIEANRRFIQIIFLISRMQLTAKDLRIFFRNQCATLNAVDQITPLMQSVLNIS